MTGASHDEFTRAVMAHFEGDAAARAKADVEEYFDYRKPYTGSQFEIVADSATPDSITAADIVAVSTLSVDVPATVSIWLLSEPGRLAVTQLLSGVPADVELWERPDLLDQGGRLWRLWDLLAEAAWPESTRSNGMGRTKISKLMAAKRPRLVPVLDSVVRAALPEPANYWAAFASLVTDPARRSTILAATATAPPHLSLLRRLDVALWMAHRNDRHSYTHGQAG